MQQWVISPRGRIPPTSKSIITGDSLPQSGMAVAKRPIWHSLHAPDANRESCSQISTEKSPINLILESTRMTARYFMASLPRSPRFVCRFDTWKFGPVRIRRRAENRVKTATISHRIIRQQQSRYGQDFNAHFKSICGWSVNYPTFSSLHLPLRHLSSVVIYKQLTHFN